MSAGNPKKMHQRYKLEQRVNQIFALLWVAFGGVVLMQSRELAYKGMYGPGPGFLPFWIGVGLIILGLMQLAQFTLSRKEFEIFLLPSKHAAWQMFLVMFGFFGFAFLVEKIGFLFCIGLLFLFLLVFVERRSWKFSLSISIISTLTFWAIFELGLKLQLPKSIFGFL